MRALKLTFFIIFIFSFLTSAEIKGGEGTFTLDIENIHEQIQGHYTTVSICAKGAEKPIDRFLLSIAYDTSLLLIESVNRGDLLRRCNGWAMNYQLSIRALSEADSLVGLIKITAF
jgi:hypothetical protein